MDTIFGKNYFWNFPKRTPIEIDDFQAAVEDSGPERLTVSRQLVYTLMDDIIVDLRKSLGATRNDAKRLLSAKFILLEIITSKAYIEYFTTFLNDNHKFRALHNKNDGLESKL